MQNIGVGLNLIDVDSLALINAFNFNYSDNQKNVNQAIALLNIGADTSNLDILQGNLPVLSRNLQIAGHHFTQRITKSLGLDFAAAEKFKLNPKEQGQLSDALQPVITDLANAIRDSFDYYESENPSVVKKIFLSGGGSQIIGLKDILVNVLGIEVDYWDCFKKIKIVEQNDAQKLKGVSNQLAVAVGLSLRQ